MAETASPPNHLRKITIADVGVGMYLEDVCTDKGVLLLSRNVSVQNEDQIEKLRRHGVTSVIINIQKGRDVDPSKRAAPASPPPEVTVRRVEAEQREKAYYEELGRAREVHTETVDVISKTLKAIRSGQSFSPRNVEQLATRLVQSISRNPDALLSLTQIKGFDEYLLTHSVNVGILMASVAAEIGAPASSLEEVALAGLLHDVGKLKVPDFILNKPGKLTEGEFAVIKRHPEMGLEILQNKMTVPDIVRKVVAQHHERISGKGYPMGLAGARIHEMAVIGAVADVFDALTSDRCYKEAWTPQKALAIIFQGSEVEYSKKIVEVFTRHLGIYPVGSFVKLIGGEMGIVLRVDKGHLLAPVVLVLFGADNKPLLTPVEYDLSEKQAGPNGDKFKIEVSLNPKAFNVNIGSYLKAAKV